MTLPSIELLTIVLILFGVAAGLAGSRLGQRNTSTPTTHQYSVTWNN